MNFEVDRYSSAWAHIALCADLTWTTEPPDDFIIANQNALAGQNSSQNLNQDSNNSGALSAKDVIPESRLAQYYGNFYYDEAREKCYISPNERPPSTDYCGQSSENFDVTECWMLPEVEYWFRKLQEEPERGARRRRHGRNVSDEDFGRCDVASSEEAALAARVLSVRGLWAAPRGASPPPAPRKMRARRRQPRRLAPPTPAPLAYCIQGAVPLVCDPNCKIQFDSPRPPQLSDYQRNVSRLSASVQALMRASAARSMPYVRNVSRYSAATANGRERRPGLWWPRDHASPRTRQHNTDKHKPEDTPRPPEKEQETPQEKDTTDKTEPEPSPVKPPEKQAESPRKAKEQVDEQVPSTSTAVADAGRKKRLYSTVLSMSAPSPVNLAQVRLSQKFVTPGLLKLNPKIVLPTTRLRPANVDNKFEELEKEALEQYKPSDESIDTKFHELEKQAEEQYSNSNSNTSCSSGEKRAATSPSDANNKQTAKFQKDKSVDSVIIYSQNFPDLNSSKPQTSSGTNLKNFHAPPRGEKKEQTHRPCKQRAVKTECHRAASDTDYEARETRGTAGRPGGCGGRGAPHAGPPKKRHLSLCVSDFSSDEEEAARCIKDASPCVKSYSTGKVKMSAHGAGDLHPILRKT